MSRSYKHTPYWGDQKDQFYKKYSNRKIRRNKDCDEDGEILNHGLYKKKTDAWDIWDYGGIETTNFQKYYERYMRNWEELSRLYPKSAGPRPTKKEVWKHYKIEFLRK